MKRLGVLVLAALVCLPVWAQVTGRISGNVTDPSGDAIVGAQVTAVNERTGETRTVQTNDLGAFVLTGMPPSVYTLRAEFEGFRPLEKTNLVLNANQILSVGDFRLEIGAITEKVTVVAEGVQVQTETSGNTALLSDNQLQGMPSRGRDVTSLMVLMPGASQNTDSDALGGNWGSATPNMNGLRSYYNTFKLDGQPGSDIDVLNYFTISVSMDAIQEVSVKTNSYTAEEGRLPGVHVNIISKSGTNEFHGSGYWFKRHESFNANSYFNNQQGVSRPANRFDTFGGTVGGPIYIPGKFNTNKDKLFFYASYERWKIRLPGNLFQTTLPTELERQGDFSQSFDQNGQLITVFDPNTLDPETGTKQPFAGNIIPSDRIDPSGQGLLNFHPMPNFFDTNITRGAFNYRALDEVGQPKQQVQLKFDWVPTSKDRISFRPRWWRSDRQAQVSSTAFTANFFKQRHHYNYPTVAYQGSYTRTFSATVLNEFNMGWDKREELGDLNDEFQLEDVRRADYAPNLPQLFDVNPLGLMPQMSFGGLPNSPSSNFDPRTPIAAKDTRWFISNNVSWIKNNHTLKFGVYWELNDASEGPRAAQLGRHMGTFDFGRDANNPFDSNHPFANALLGNFTSYAEANNLTDGLARTYTLEWFAQDSWKVTRRLTVDLGIRFYSFTPWRLVNDDGSAFVLDRFNVADIPAFFEPALDAQGRRVAQNPLTGEYAPVPLIGAFVPGSGNRLNGRVPSGDSSVPDGFRERPPIQVAPRIGFAYDVFGNGKTAVRGGFGITKQAIFSSQNTMWITTTSPPLVESPQIFYDNIENLRNADTEIFFPADAQAFDEDYGNPPTVYNWSFGIQQELAQGTVLDVSYVGSIGQHLRQQLNRNVLPPGTRFLESSIDQTTGRPLPDNFLRPYRGLSGNVPYLQDTGWSNYNGLQVALNRRYTAGIQFGLSYTYSKAMGIANTSGDGSGLPLYTNYRTYLYGKMPYDQTHVLTFNYVWTLPNSAALGKNAFARAVFHDWELAGILTFASGFPSGVGFSYTDGVDRWGGGDGPRTEILDNPNFGYGDREFEQWFNTAAIGAPGNTFGNAPIDVFRGPGINNWDSTIYKYFRFTEQVNLRIGFEFYNFLNHTQFSSVDTGARFDPQGNQVNGRFGQVTGTRNPRQMQFTARITF